MVSAGTWRDTRPGSSGRLEGLLVADLHVHPFPGDGVLTVRQLQREAQRREIDVIAIAGHNNRVALDLAHALGRVSAETIVLESQELTAPDFHMIAVGVRDMIDWRLSVSDAVRAIHAQGGAAIAAHPSPRTWKPLDAASLAALDGVEVAHRVSRAETRQRMEAFLARVRAVNPDVAPIGSTDFHITAPLGLCRTYLLTVDRSAAGAIAAIRQGRTVAQDQEGRFYGSPAHVAEVERQLASAAPPAGVPWVDRLIALAALLGLAALSLCTVPGRIKIP
jgi:predicted metal-dependent phosphoesterase TrpH